MRTRQEEGGTESKQNTAAVYVVGVAQQCHPNQKNPRLPCPAPPAYPSRCCHYNMYTHVQPRSHTHTLTHIRPSIPSPLHTHTHAHADTHPCSQRACRCRAPQSGATGTRTRGQGRPPLWGRGEGGSGGRAGGREVVWLAQLAGRGVGRVSRGVGWGATGSPFGGQAPLNTPPPSLGCEGSEVAPVTLYTLCTLRTLPPQHCGSPPYPSPPFLHPLPLAPSPLSLAP